MNRTIFFCFTFLCCLAFSNNAIAQVDIYKEKIYTYVDRMPCICESNSSFSKKEKKEFCDTKLKDFMLKHLKYPESARRNGLEGIVFVRFIVDKDGSIIEPELLNDIGNGCGAEALRVVRLMPKWIPGMQANQPVPVQFDIPVRFSMEEHQPHSTSTASPEEVVKVAGAFLFIMKKIIEHDENKNKN